MPVLKVDVYSRVVVSSRLSYLELDQDSLRRRDFQLRRKDVFLANSHLLPML